MRGVFFYLHDFASRPQSMVERLLKESYVMRSVCAKWTFPNGCIAFSRTPLHINPGRGLIIAWPHRIMSILFVNLRMSG